MNAAAAAPSTENADSDVDLAGTRIAFSTRILMSPAVAVAVIIGLFVLYASTQTDQFAETQTWINILRVAVFPTIVAVFATMVIVSGGLDLSVGSVLVAGAMSSAYMADANYGIAVSVVTGIGVGALVGLINGLLINYGRISAIIVTLGTLFAVKSIVVTLSKGNSIGPLPEDYTWIGTGTLFGIPYLVWYAIVVVLFAYFLLHMTNFGWSLRAIGGNRDAARSAGIKVERLSTIVYILSGCAAGLAGVLLAARLGAGSPSLGSGFELQVIAAAIIGGTSIAGAIGTVPGAVLGSLLLSVLGTGLVLLHVDPTLQDLVTGVVLILAAGLDQLRRRQMFKASRRTTRAEDAA